MSDGDTMKLAQKLGLDRTKVQFFLGSMFVIVVALVVTVSIIYISMYNLQKKNASRYIGEIADQMSGHIESLLNEVDILTLQVAMDERVQQILERTLEGRAVSYEEKMKMHSVMMSRSIYSKTIEEVELFSLERSIYPIVDKTIQDRVGAGYAAEADKPLKAGKLIWTGWDPEYGNSLLAIRQVKLENRDYRPGGYVLVRVKASLLEFVRNDLVYPEGTVMTLTDANRNSMLTAVPNGLNAGDLASGKAQYIRVEHTIPSTGWRLEIWIPTRAVMSEITILRDILLWGSLVTVILSALLAYAGSQFITSPLNRLSRVIVRAQNGTPEENPEVYFNRDVNRLNMTYNRMVRDIHHLIESVYEKEMLKIKSEITALHSQINPHFLFNTLDALYWALVRKGEKELSQFIAQLADLMRYSIRSHGSGGFVTVRQELDQVGRYVGIMNIRWRERLQFESEIDPEAETCSIPKLTIQPLVENAIMHGIEPLEKGGAVRLMVAVREGMLICKVQDEGVGIGPERLAEIRQRLALGSNEPLTAGRGLGLYNVHRLIRLHFGERYGLVIDSGEGSGTTVVLTLPAMRKEADAYASGYSGGRR